MAGSANSIQTHNVLRGRLSEDNVIAGTVGTGYNPTYALVGEAAAQIVLYINSSDYKMYAELKDKNGNHIMNSNIIDLPLETMVVNGSYDSETREVVLILDNGNELRFSVADLVRGLVSEEDLVTTLGDYVKFTDYAGNGIAGVIKAGRASVVNNGFLEPQKLTYTQYTAFGDNSFIGKGTLENVITGKQLVNKTYVDEADDVFEEDLFGDALINDSGEDITLENTIEEGLLRINLKGNTSQEVIQGEVGLAVENTSIYVDDVNTTKENYINLKGNTYQDSTSGYNNLATITNLNYIKTKNTNGNWNNNSYSINGITFTFNSNGTITINGTSTQNASLKLLGNYFPIDQETINGNYIILGYTSSDIAMRVLNYGETYTFLGVNQSSTTPTQLDLSTFTTGYVEIVVSSGKTINNVTIKPMLTNTSQTDYEPYTNGASPNPDYPQEVEVVTGLNEVKVEGKNLLDTKVFKNRMINCYVVNSNGTITQTATDTNHWQSSYLPNSIILNSGTYTISVSNRNGSKLQIYNLTTNSNIVETSVDSYTFTLNNDNQVINTKLYGANSYPFTFTMQIEKGSQATTYEAYKGQTYEVNLGKNLFDKDNANYVNLTVNTADMRYYNASDNRAKLYYIKCKPNTTYTYSKSLGSFLRICSSPNIPAHNGVIGVINSNTTGTSTTITTGANDNYISIYPLLITEIDTVGYDNVLSTIQIEQGDKATSYAPYFTPIELCKIGTYQDRIYKSNGNWYLHKEIHKIILDGSESGWGYDTQYKYFRNPSYNFGNNIPLEMNNANRNTYMQYMNLFKINKAWSGTNSFRDNVSVQGEFYPSQNVGYKVMFRNLNIDNVTDLQAWLSTHNVINYYPLQTPTETQITDTTLVNQLNALYNATIYSTTHINTETSNLLPYIDLKYNVITPAPSPERASEVEVVTGNNAIYVMTENLSNGINQNYWINTSTTNGGKADGNSGLAISVDGLSKYTISTKTSQTRYRVACSNTLPDSTINVYNGQNKDNTSDTITIDTKGYNYLIINATDLSSVYVVKGASSKLQTYNLTLGNLELCKIGDYQDYFYKDNGNWYKYGAIGKVVLNGSEEFTSYQYDNSIAMYKDNSLLYITGQSSYCDRFSLESSSISNMTNGEYRISVVSNNTYILFKSEETNNISIFKTWLSNHNTNVYGILTTPTQIQITDQLLVSQLDELQKAMSYYDKTLITQTNAKKPFILDVTTFKNTTKGKIEVIEEKNQSFENKDNKVIIINSSSTDTQYPSAKCVYDLVGDVESILETLDVGSGV